MQGRSLFDEPEFQKLAREYEERWRPRHGTVATIDDVVAGRWYVLELEPGREVWAIRHVVDRMHLGCYVPVRREARYYYRGVARIVTRALFVGYGFVLSRGIKQHWQTITACPGVRGIMTITTDAEIEGTTVTAPAIIGSAMIDMFKAVENGQDAVLAGQLQEHQDELTRVYRRRFARRYGRATSPPPEPIEIVP
jgi:transcription antitermination factor NusG